MKPKWEGRYKKHGFRIMMNWDLRVNSCHEDFRIKQTKYETDFEVTKIVDY